MHLQGLEIVCHCITEAIKKRGRVTDHPADTFHDSSPQFQGAFVSFTLSCPDCCWLVGLSALRVQDGQVGEGGGCNEINRGTSKSTT